MKTEIAVILSIAIVIGVAYSAYTSFVPGTLVIKVTDPPKGWGDASKVYIHISGIDLHRIGGTDQAGWVSIIGQDNWIDLSQAINVTKTLGSTTLQPGTYNLIRFEILEGLVTVSGQNYTASVESGKLNIAILNGGVKIFGGQTTGVVIDVSPKLVGFLAKGLKIVPAAKAFQES